MRLITIEELNALNKRNKEEGFELMISSQNIDERLRVLVKVRVSYYCPRAEASAPKAEHLIDEYCAFKYFDKDGKEISSYE